MKKKITETILSLPPYISTSWTNVEALTMQGNELIVRLLDGSEARVPNLTEEELEEIFLGHSKFLELASGPVAEDKSSKQENTFQPEIIAEAFNKLSKLFTAGSSGSGQAFTDLPLQFGMGAGGLEGIASAMQHDPSQKDSPDLPSEILDKVASIAKLLGQSDQMMIPEAEPHCNCFHCQVARTIQSALNGDEEIVENVEQLEELEEVNDEDLKFREWDIQQENEKMYRVSNPLDSSEVYHVYLGEPLGCTCGVPNCEHVRAVLES